MEDSFDYMLTGLQTKKLLERTCESEMADCGLRQVELEILYYLACDERGDTASEILRDWHFSKAHISKSVDNLHRHGCITLAEDPDDRRCIHIRPTAEGKALVARYREVRAQVFARIFAGLTEEERLCVRQAVGKIQANIRAQLED